MVGVQSKAERIAMIREAHRKMQVKAVAKTRVPKKQKEQEDERHWTDAPRYAAEYYGEVYRETTKFDNDWD